jgi:hypothetical protein
VQPISPRNASFAFLRVAELSAWIAWAGWTTSSSWAEGRVLQALSRLQHETQREIPATVFFVDPTPAAIATALVERGGAGIPANRLAHARTRDAAASAAEPIALIAMSGRFPGAASAEALWENLCAGRESITFFPADRLDPSIAPALRDDPAYVRARGVIDGVEMFDAEFFGIAPGSRADGPTAAPLHGS